MISQKIYLQNETLVTGLFKVIIEWSKKASKKYVSKELAEKIHKNAAPFVTWLQEVSLGFLHYGKYFSLKPMHW